MRRVPRQLFRVPMRERVLHRIVGIGGFGRLLDLSGWNRLIEPVRGFSGKRARLTIPGRACASRRHRPWNLLCHPCIIGRPRTFQKASVERRTIDAVAKSGRSFLPGATTALHHAPNPAAAG